MHRVTMFEGNEVRQVADGSGLTAGTALVDLLQGRGVEQSNSALGPV